MEIHKPKPTHNWREFLIELGTITLGVMIALAAEQAVEGWREHRQYQAGEQAMRAELGLTVSNLNRRKQFSACITRRIDEISALLDRAEAHQPFTPLQWIGAPNTFVIRTSSESLVSRNDLFTPQEQSVYGPMYSFIDSMRLYQDQERMAWAHLQPLEGRATLSPEMIADLRAALGEARLGQERFRNNLAWIHAFAARNGIAENASNEWIAMRPQAWPICLPTSASRAEGERMMFYMEERK